MDNESWRSFHIQRERFRWKSGKKKQIKHGQIILQYHSVRIRRVGFRENSMECLSIVVLMCSLLATPDDIIMDNVMVKSIIHHSRGKFSPLHNKGVIATLWHLSLMSIQSISTENLNKFIQLYRTIFIVTSLTRSVTYIFVSVTLQV